MSNKLPAKECGRRAFRTFLQTACGVLGAGLVAAVTDLVEQTPGWKAGIITLLASAISAGIAAVMNRGEGLCSAQTADPDAEPETESGDSGKPA